MSSARPQQNRLLGIALRIGAATGFAFMGAMIKLGYEAGVSTPELVFYRFAFGLPPLLIWIGWSRNFTVWRTERPFAHLWRAATGLTAMALAFTALYYLPLAEAATIGFTAPLFAVILSVLVLREKVGRHRWAAVAIGLLGVLIVMRPQGSDLPAVGLVIAAFAAFGVAITTITIRQIGETDATQTIVFWFTMIGMLVVGTLMPFFGEVHDGRTWLILLALGGFGGISQLFLTASLRFAPVPVIMPFDYTQLIWSVWLGWLFWETQPAITTWIGAIVIVISGLYTIYREHHLGRDRLRAEPPL